MANERGTLASHKPRADFVRMQLRFESLKTSTDGVDLDAVLCQPSMPIIRCFSGELGTTFKVTQGFITAAQIAKQVYVTPEHHYKIASYAPHTSLVPLFDWRSNRIDPQQVVLHVSYRTHVVTTSSPLIQPFPYALVVGVPAAATFALLAALLCWPCLLWGVLPSSTSDAQERAASAHNHTKAEKLSATDDNDDEDDYDSDDSDTIDMSSPDERFPI